MRNTLTVAALGLAALFGIAACGTSVATTSAPRPRQHQRTTPAWPGKSRISRPEKDGLPPLANGEGQAALVYCDPSTVSHAPNASSSTSATCGINYSDGSVWKQNSVSDGEWA